MSTELIQQLRRETGAGILDVKKALASASGDYQAALQLLRKRGEVVAQKKADRVVSEGVIASYVHMGKIGVLVELDCETDFVARTDDFQTLAKDIAMQVAAMKPQYLSRDDVHAVVLESEKEIAEAAIDPKKPSQVKRQIVDGKLQKFYAEHCLLEQAFFRDEKQTIQDLLHEAIGKLGENIRIRRFIRYSLDDHESESR